MNGLLTPFEMEALKWGRNNDKNPTRQSRFRHLLNRYSKQALIVERSNSYGLSADKKYKQKVTIKASYTRQSSKSRVASNTESAVAYAFKYDGIEGYGSKKGTINEKEAQEMMKGKKVFKIIISPEDPALAGERYTRMVVESLELLLGRKLVWVATEHRDTDHPHTHVIISREDGEGLSFDTPLYINPNIIKKDLREKAEEIATRLRGFVYPRDLIKKDREAVNKKGFTSLDGIIAKNISLNGFFDDQCLRKIHPGKQDIVRMRLEYLTSLDVGVTRGSHGYIFTDDWRENLFDLGKIRRVVPDYTATEEKITVFKKTKEQHKAVIGKIIKKAVVDELNDRVGFVIAGQDGRLYYHEQIMDWNHYKEMVVGKEVKLSWKSLKNKHLDKAYDVARMEEYTP